MNTKRIALSLLLTAMAATPAAAIPVMKASAKKASPRWTTKVEGEHSHYEHGLPIKVAVQADGVGGLRLKEKGTSGVGNFGHGLMYMTGSTRTMNLVPVPGQKGVYVSAVRRDEHKADRYVFVKQGRRGSLTLQRSWDGGNMGNADPSLSEKEAAPVLASPKFEVKKGQYGGEFSLRFQGGKLYDVYDKSVIAYQAHAISPGVAE